MIAEVAYTAVPIGPGPDPVDGAVFGSPSAVAGWLSARTLDELAVVAAMGPTTAAALEHAGRPADIVPVPPSLDVDRRRPRHRGDDGKDTFRMSTFPTARDRRLRRTPRLRRAVAETRLHPASFVLPVFVVPGSGVERPIGAMPGHAQLSADRAAALAKEAEAAGVGGVILFGIPATKDETGSSAWDPTGPVPEAIRAIREAAPELVVWADVCLCEYTSHGHCGVLDGDRVDNDATLPLLARAAKAYADAGADVIAPSDMMDGRVGAIREALDAAGHAELAICSYSAKYASGYYGPFREAAESTPAFGDRRTHQMDPANARQALVEVRRDLEEGADMVMVKPAGPYLDVIAAVHAAVDVPVAAYQVSGEFSTIEAAAANGWVDGERLMMESLTGIARAGAGIVLTYYAVRAARLLERL